MRDWLYVEDHADALLTVLEKGQLGRSYNIGGENEARNIDLVQMICALLDDMHPQGAPHDRLITFVTDRPGHDARYAIDATKIRTELGWRPRHSFDSGLRDTVRWFLDNRRDLTEHANISLNRSELSGDYQGGLALALVRGGQGEEARRLLENFLPDPLSSGLSARERSVTIHVLAAAGDMTTARAVAATVPARALTQQENELLQRVLSLADPAAVPHVGR